MNDSNVVNLNNGVRMPALGLGLFLAPAAETAASVECAVAAGYRLFDTAAAYRNERAVGEGLRRTGIPRAEVFVTTKLWVTQYGYDAARAAFYASARRLGVDYVDLYLLHWPLAGEFERTLAAYRAMEELLAEGRIRAIGVSNFLPGHLDALCERMEVVPAVNQVELHPYFTQAATRAANACRGIVTQSWAPIGGIYGRRPENVPPNASHPLDHPVIAELAGTYGKTPAQVLIRWHLDHGFSVIPKSVNPDRIRANFDVFDFRLSPRDIARIDALDTGRRAGPDPATFTAASYVVDVDAQ
ncbi:MAG TPA: aldo/keto reductase [Woeseiaceae bacterium]|nr:aldo/keto reductase [Woeseiaceae bacterium]